MTGPGPAPTAWSAGDPDWSAARLSADCAPVLIADADVRVVAAVHAGWRGALSGVIDSAVRAMTTAGARRSSLVAAVGPCIGPSSYEIGDEFLDRFVTEIPEAARFFADGAAPDKHWFDLPGVCAVAARGGRSFARRVDRPRHVHGRDLVLFEPAGVQTRRSRLRPPGLGDHARRLRPCRRGAR